MESQKPKSQGCGVGQDLSWYASQLAGLENGHEQASHMAVLKIPNTRNSVSGTKPPLAWPICSLGMRPSGNDHNCNQTTPS